MRYRVKGEIVRSENAAKPTGTASKAMKTWIKSLDPGASVLDYGCGKLRYTILLARRVRKVVAIDSPEQCNRIQKIGRKRTTIVAYGSSLANVRVAMIEDAGWQSQRFDWVLLANVLTAIPHPKVRMEVLRNCASVLKPLKGKLLVVGTFANSRFRDWEGDDDTVKYRDGWIRNTNGFASFFAPIAPETIIRYCEAAGLKVENCHREHGETVYVTARAK